MEGNLRDIIVKAKSGDRVAQESILEKYKPLICKTAMTYYIKNYEYDDLFQLARLGVLEAIKKYSYNDERYFTAYVQRTVRNKFNSLFRQKGKERFEGSLDALVSDITNDAELVEKTLVEDVVQRNIEIKALQKILKNLDDSERRFILFLYYENRTLREWANKEGKDYQKERRLRDKILTKCKKALERNI